MNTLTLENNDTVLFTGFTDIPSSGNIVVKIIKGTLIISASASATAAGHILVRLENHTARNREFYKIVQHYAKDKPLFFLKSPASVPEYIQLR